MIFCLKQERLHLSYRILSAFLSWTLVFTLILPSGYAQPVLSLPVPGTMVSVTPGFTPTLVKGMTIHPENPLQFDFIVDPGDSQIAGQELIKESNKLIKYFLASLTIPEKDLWVNLSPYEKDRIIPDGFGRTEMGRDLLTQDYLLKQLTASLIYPENDLGKRFWERIYKKAREQFNSTEIPMNTFNKVWIVPQDAVVYEKDGSVFVVNSHLKVMLEEDYLAKSKIQDQKSKINLTPATEVIREIVIPEIEKEVNEGKNFADLRQVYNSMILAVWYKQTLKESLLGKVYVDQNKIKGVDLDDPQVKQKIYEQYLASFKQGVYNYIKEEYDEKTQEVIPRQYFSGGLVAVKSDRVLTGDLAMMGEADRKLVVNATRGGEDAFRVDLVLAEEAPSASGIAELSRRGFLTALAASLTCTALGCGGGGGKSSSAKITQQPQPPPTEPTPAKPTAPIAAKRNIFAPPPGRIIVSVGQQLDIIDDYAKNFGAPAVLMTYTSIQDLEGLGIRADRGGGEQHAQHLIDNYPHSALQLGLYMVDALDKINAGGYDDHIEKLGEWIKQAHRPIYLRVGYEFDLTDNHYFPEKYKAAYRRIVDHLRAQGVDNVTFVWHSASDSDSRERLLQWYPGDDYVDWVGLSFFGISPDRIANYNLIAELAADLNKHLMIAESTPSGFITTQAKQEWFEALFDFIEAQPVEMLNYINSNWDVLPLFKKDGWGDARIQNDTTIRDLWRRMVLGNESYLQSSPEFLAQIGFDGAMLSEGRAKEIELVDGMLENIHAYYPLNRLVANDLIPLWAGGKSRRIFLWQANMNNLESQRYLKYVTQILQQIIDKLSPLENYQTHSPQLVVLNQENMRILGMTLGDNASIKRYKQFIVDIRRELTKVRNPPDNSMIADQSESNDESFLTVKPNRLDHARLRQELAIKLGLRIRELQEEKKVKTEVLISEVGVTTGMISLWRTGKRLPQPAKIKSLADERALGKGILDVFAISEGDGFGDIILKRRYQEGLTRKEFGRRIGVSETAIMLWESGKASQIKVSSYTKLIASMGKEMAAGLAVEAEESSPVSVKKNRLNLDELRRELTVQLSGKLQQLRRERKFVADILISKLGIFPSMFKMWIEGIFLPEPPNLAKLINALGKESGKEILNVFAIKKEDGFGERVFKRRYQEGLTQIVLAAEAQVSNKTISRLETGESVRIERKAYNSLIRVLGDELLAFSDRAILTDARFKQAAAPNLQVDENGTPVGGINLDPALLNLQIKRDGKGIPLPVSQQPILEMKIDGFVPVIINVTPVNLPQLLGLANMQESPTDLSRKTAPAQPAVESPTMNPVEPSDRSPTRKPDEVSFLK